MTESPHPENADGFTVRVELLAWVRTFIGGPAEGSQDFDEPARPGDTVRDVLRRLSGRYPELSAALWEGNQIGPHIEIVVNNTILGNDFDLDSEVKPGFEILLAGQYIGG